jgi:hypothetical protein
MVAPSKDSNDEIIKNQYETGHEILINLEDSSTLLFKKSEQNHNLIITHRQSGGILKLFENKPNTILLRKGNTL